MIGRKKEGAPVYKDRILPITGLVLVLIAVLLVAAYAKINVDLRASSIRRMEEGVHTVIEEVTSKLERDSRVLNAAANIISHTNNFDIEATRETMAGISSLLETMQINVLMAGDSVLTTEGDIIDVSAVEELTFANEAPLGEHVSNRKDSLTSNEQILRHFVPIIQNGQTAAMLYGVTNLDSLPDALNISNIYNASASVYIVDTKTGDFILDTWHDHLGNIADFSPDVSKRETKGPQDWVTYTDDLLHLGEGSVIYRTPQTDGWQYMYYAPAGINEWAIAVSVPEREVFSSVYAVQRVWTVVGALFLIVIVVYYFWVRRNARQVMKQAVERAVLREKLMKAEAADRAKSTFLSNMSHDIRTPMNAIIGFATLAQANLNTPERVQDYLGKILSSSNHLLSLINDILDMSRIESGKLNIEEKPCAISDIFRDMRSIIQTEMHTKELNFFMDTVDITDENIYCDKLHLNQVLLNLLSNAIKFTPAGGTVALTIRQKPSAPKGYGSYEIRVKDTGIGMSAEFAQHIFEPFERERTSTVSGIQGTGLGMAITKSIVDTMGGSIQVQTEQGKGSEFIINLDFRLQSEHNQVEVVRELEGMRALVVDDNFATCDSVTKMLRQIGLRSEWTLHGKEAVLRARQAVEMGDSYRVFIIDWFMPDLNGLEVVRQIRAIVGEDAPIIIVTAYDWSAFEEEARSAGVTAFCNKPIFLSELRDILMASAVKKPEDEKTAQQEQRENPYKGIRLLVAEDNALNREIAVELLNESGFQVETAEDGGEAVEMVKRSKPGYYALVLMDIQMPTMNGYDAAKAIRALENPELSRIPIIAMTADAFEEDRRRALESGMNAHVVKPIDINKLVESLAEFL